MADGNATVLRMKGITKRYPGVVALDDISVEFQKGEVHALLGENGAGKSTLIKVLAGAVESDAGTIEIDGETIEHMTPSLSRAHGIEVIYQEYNLIPGLTVAENIYLGSQTKGLVNKKQMYQAAAELLKHYKIDVDPGAYVKNLPTAKQQLVEISKAISKNAKIIVMDEPTAQLSLAEVETLYSIIRDLRNKGTTIIYISHRLEELFAVTDRVTVMRDGGYVDTVNTSEVDRDQLIALMVGRELNAGYPERNCVQEEVVLKVENVGGYNNSDVFFELHRGEILGFAGLVGAGRTELMRTIFGADKRTEGSIYIYGNKTDIRSPEDAIASGMGLIPEDRKGQGCFLNSSIEWNISIGNIRKLTTHHLIDRRKIRKQAESYSDLLAIKTPSLQQKVGNLSGGNQQKVVLAKTLAADSDIIIFDEPTRGIDVGARHEIYVLMSRLVEEGKSILMVSSDMEELIGMSDRIIVLSEGRVSGTLKKSEFTQEKIMAFASPE